MNIRLLSVYSVLVVSFHTCFGQDQEAAASSSIISSDFFSDALKDAQAADSDAMGTQRLVQVKSSDLTPAIALGSSFKYTTNPEKAWHILNSDYKTDISESMDEETILKFEGQIESEFNEEYKKNTAILV